MKRLLFCLMMMVGMLLEALAQSYETQYRRPVNNVMQDIAKRFGVKFRFDSDVDTAGVMLTYADFRIRPYSLEQTLDNICKHLGWNWWKQNGNLYRIKLYEYPRRHVDEGRQMLDYLAAIASVWSLMLSWIPVFWVKRCFLRYASTMAIPHRTSVSSSSRDSISSAPFTLRRRKV